MRRAYPLCPQTSNTRSRTPAASAPDRQGHLNLLNWLAGLLDTTSDRRTTGSVPAVSTRYADDTPVIT